MKKLQNPGYIDTSEMKYVISGKRERDFIKFAAFILASDASILSRNKELMTEIEEPESEENRHEIYG
jgi:predicted nucleic acid-binding protein